MFHLLLLCRVAVLPPEQHILPNAPSSSIVTFEDFVVHAREHAVPNGELAQMSKRQVHVVACHSVPCIGIVQKTECS
eukprot:4691577-Pleurochrysis_carterae.AAC.1